MRKLSNHLVIFVEDQCIWGKQQTVYVDALYDVYCRWCQDQGIRPAFKVWFGIQLRDLGRDITDGFDQRKGGRLHYYTGVRYKVPEEGGMFPPMLNDLPESSIYLPTSKQTEILKEIKRRNALSEGEDPPPV